MTGRGPLLALATALLVSAAAQAPAHDTPVPPMCVETNSPALILAHFDFQPFELQKYADTHVVYDLATFAPCSSTNSRMPCGIVDDWHWAAQMAGEFCGGPAGPQRSLAPPGVEVAVPAVFNDINQHHSGYRFSMGLKGVCYTCPILNTNASPRSK